MILVTGVTGTTGSATLTGLAARGARERAMVRDPARAAAAGLTTQGQMELVRGDFGDAASLRAALAGVTRALLISPPTYENFRLEAAFIDAARSAGVKHVVKLSAIGASVDAPHRFGRWHHAAEEHLRRSGLAWTMLRPTFFMQNLLGQAGAVKSGTIRMPAGEGRAGFVDCRDIAASASACLTSPGHEGKAYELSGPASIGYAQIAATFSLVLGREVKYVDVPPDAARAAMVASGLPEWLADGLNELNAELRQNRWDRVSDAVPALAGRPGIRFEQFVRDNAAAFA